MFRAPIPSVRPAPPPLVATRGLRRPNIDLTSDVEGMRRHISGHEPIYFAIGTRDRLNARFQFSFKYRVLDPGPDESELGPVTDALGMLYFAYTQTSIWDLQGFSRPFYDSSYKPALFLQHALPRIPGSDWIFTLRGGAQHESNGKGGGAVTPATGPGLVATNRLRHPSDSRSLNTFFAAATARWEDVGARFLEASFQVHSYFQADDNPDIAAYRGHAELRLRGGYTRGLQLAAHLRGRPAGHGSVEFNLTWPTSESPLLRALPLIGSLGGYAQIQYFNGYGESLLDYDVRRRDQLRLGLMIVR
jgi:outer membrane phospholipase A